MMQADLYRDLLDRLARDLKVLPDKSEETPASTLSALWHAAAGTPRSARHVGQDDLPALDDAARASLLAMIERRLTGVPLAHLTGRQHFMGLELLASGEALVPREETELLGYAALALVRERVAEAGQATVLDVCTGSGNLAVALAWHEPRARVFGADLSVDAVGLARRNAQQLGLADRVEFRDGDLLAPFDEPAFHGVVDCLTCNPPYISSAKVGSMAEEIAAHEPRLAFDGGPFGIRILQRLITDAPRFLRPGGWVAFEVGLGQGPAMAQRVQGNPRYVETRTVSDRAGSVRAILARTGTT
jgi:release factor glutamine methyltransferase